MYSIKLKSGREIFRAKGVNRVQGRNFLHHDLFLSVLNNETELHHTLHYIRQMGFKNFNISLRKKTLSCYDDKRFQVNAICSIPYGYQGEILADQTYFNAHFHHNNIEANVLPNDDEPDNSSEALDILLALIDAESESQDEEEEEE